MEKDIRSTAKATTAIAGMALAGGLAAVALGGVLSPTPAMAKSASSICEAYIWNHPKAVSCIAGAKISKGKLLLKGNGRSFSVLSTPGKPKKTYRVSSKCKFYTRAHWSNKVLKNGKVKTSMKFKSRISRAKAVKLLKKAGTKVKYNKKTKRFSPEYDRQLIFQTKHGKVVKLSIASKW